jgi:hypothetical protein
MNGIFVGRAALAHWPADADFFAAATRVWGHFFESEREVGTSDPLAARVEVRLWGFARHHRDNVRALIQEILGGEVLNFDSDTLKWTGRWHDSLHDWEYATRQIMNQMLANEKFEGWFMMARLELVECYVPLDNGETKRQKRGNSLVFWGRLHSGKMVIAAVWPSANWGRELSNITLPGFVNDAILREIDQVRAGATPNIHKDFKYLFVSPGEAKAQAGFANFFTASTMSVILRRQICLMALMTLGWWSLLLNPEQNKWVIIPTLAVSALFFLFLTAYGKGLMQCHRNLNEDFKEIYSQPISFPQKTIGWEYEPTSSKFSQELSHVGATFISDVGFDPDFTGTAAMRIFQMLDGSIFLLVFLLRTKDDLAPAVANFTIVTHFSDGFRMVLNAGTSTSPNFCPSQKQQSFWPMAPGVPEMLAYQKEMLAWHQKAGRTVKQLKGDDIIPQLVEDHEMERCAFKSHGCLSWKQTLRYFFQLENVENAHPNIDLARIIREEGATSP